MMIKSVDQVVKTEGEHERMRGREQGPEQNNKGRSEGKLNE